MQKFELLLEPNSFSVQLYITEEDLIAVKADIVAFLSERLERPIEDFVAYRKWCDDGGQCKAITKTGTRCKNGCQDFTSPQPYFNDFVRGRSDFCQTHR